MTNPSPLENMNTAIQLVPKDRDQPYSDMICGATTGIARSKMTPAPNPVPIAPAATDHHRLIGFENNAISPNALECLLILSTWTTSPIPLHGLADRRKDGGGIPFPTVSVISPSSEGERSGLEGRRPER
jgi:hypothetical protein